MSTEPLRYFKSNRLWRIKKMTFAAPTWIRGIIVMAGYAIIPLLIGIMMAAIGFKSKNNAFQKISLAILVICIITAILGPSIFWHYQWEVPSVSEKTITVASWQPKAGIEVNDNGLMVIDSADDLMMVTTTGEGFIIKLPRLIEAVDF